MERASEPNLNAQLVHNRLQMRSSRANYSALSYWKYAHAGEYEQGRTKLANRR